jgi:hypothetical protein
VEDEKFTRIRMDIDLGFRVEVPQEAVDMIGTAMGKSLAEFLAMAGLDPVHVVIEAKGDHLPASYADPELN